MRQERGLDNFITALMNQAQANQEGPRRAPEEMISSLPRKHLSADDIGVFSSSSSLAARCAEVDGCGPTAAFRHAECAICKDDFHPDDDVITLECDHVFHAVRLPYATYEQLVLLLRLLAWELLAREDLTEQVSNKREDRRHGSTACRVDVEVRLSVTVFVFVIMSLV